MVFTTKCERKTFENNAMALLLIRSENDEKATENSIIWI